MANYFRYEPSLSVAVIFIVIFAMSSTLHLLQIIKTKSWLLLPFLVGSLFETIGFVGRAIIAEESPRYTVGPCVMHNLLLLLGPTCYSAAIYMILGSYIRQLKGEQCSLIKPCWLTKIFLIGDITSIVLQAIDGGKLVKVDGAHGKSPPEDIVIAGLIVQIVFFSLFIVLTGLFHYRFAKRLPGRPPGWQNLVVIVYVISILIFIRSLFRMIEYIQGCDGELQSREIYIYALDAFPMALASIALNACHPSTYLHDDKKSPDESDSEMTLDFPYVPPRETQCV